ncbi:MAG: Oligoendopeptidase [Alphaproteobacteria bacterium]|nr:Oligoendopeptidase [Alphaproteobacteria bacterium]
MPDVNPMERKFFHKEFAVTDWEGVQPFADDLLSREIDSPAEFERFLEDQNELDVILWDDYAWREIRATCNTEDKEAAQRLEEYEQNIAPPLAVLKDKIGRKILSSVYAPQYEKPGFAIMRQRLKDKEKVFHPDNTALANSISQNVAAVRALEGKRSVTLDGTDYTFEQAADMLSLNDRSKREEAWKATANRLAQDKTELDVIFDDMFRLRQAQAKNVGLENYRDYKYIELGRCYTPSDSEKFYQGIKENVVPLLKTMHETRKENMGVTHLYPWDLLVDPLNRKPVKAFENAGDLVEKSQTMFDNIDPVFGAVFRSIKEKGHLDLMSRMGKASGAYLQPLYEKNIPFMYQNATGKMDGVGTISHEGGHAVHEVLMAPVGFKAYRDYPMEIAELGSMAMELISMDHWDVFYDNKEELLRAKREHLENIIVKLPWIGIVAEFQDKLYVDGNPGIEQRHELWEELRKQYDTGEVETTEYPHPTRTSWHKQNHIFSVPFYYIDYGIAQLGALQVWRNYKQEPEKALAQFKEGLTLGNTKSIKDVYETAGAKFDFSSEMQKELMQFVGEEIETLREQEMAEYRKNNPVVS